MNDKPTIVLTDDDEDDRDFFRMAVESNNLGYNLLMFPDGVALKAYLSSSSHDVPHIIFLDINMPLLDGFQVLEHIRQHYSAQQLPVVMYTTSNSDVDREQSMRLGANMYVRKPNDYKALRTMISDVIGKLSA